MSTLTKRQSAILEFIRAYVDRHRFPPTLREIGCHFDIKTRGGVLYHIHAMEEKGAISRRPGRPRTIMVTA